MKKYSFNIIMVVLILAVFSSCTRYYKVHTLAPFTASSKLAVIDSLNKKGKYFMMHTIDSVHSFHNVSINPADSTIKGVLKTVPPEHSHYLNPDRHFIYGKLKTYQKPQAGILDEVHLYSNNAIRDTVFNIPVQDIQKIETIEDNRKKSATS